MSNNNKSNSNDGLSRLRPKRKSSSVFIAIGDVKKETNKADITERKNGSAVAFLEDDKKGTKNKKQQTQVMFPGGKESTAEIAKDVENKADGLNNNKLLKNKESTEDDVKISDDMVDACKTICQICHETFRLSMMRFHTLKQHDLQITKYKEIHGNFHEDRSMIVEIVYHKCHLCGKLVLLDNDSLGGHIKGTHKWTEKDYKAQFMTLSVSKAQPTHQKNIDQEYDIDTVKFKLVDSGKCDDTEYDFATSFPDFEYDCNISDCNLCKTATKNCEEVDPGDSVGQNTSKGF